MINCRKLTFSFLAFVGLFVAVLFSFGIVTSSAQSFWQGQKHQLSNSPVFSEFDAWVKEFADENFDDNERNKLGETLVVKRRQLLKELMQINPKAALEKTISAEDFNRLPTFITKNLEKRISGYGDFNVYAFDSIDSLTGAIRGSEIEREVVFGDARYKAFVYGRRKAMTTKLKIPLQGIVIDDVMVVDESPARNIEPANYAAREVDETKLAENGAAAEIGGEIKYFSSQSELNAFVNEQIDWESKISPERPQEKLAPNEIASTWTEGAKKVLYIRVDFPDKPGEPIDGQTGLPLTIQRVQEEMDKVNTVYTNSSYGKTSFQSVTVTPVIRLPQPASFYMPSLTVMKFNEIMTDARNAARTAGFETNNYDLDVVASINNGVNAAGLGSVGGKGTWLLGYFNLGYPLHEIGHNYGLNHSGVWRTTDGTVIGQGNETGGDLFDAMAYNGYGLSATHFMASDKRHLDWLTDANVQNITSDGVYRVFAQDAPNPNNIRLLRIKKDSSRNYDLEFRQTITSNPNAMNGALIRWHYPQTRTAQLLDMTPTTNTFPAGVADAPLMVGQSFFDNVSRIRITVLGKGNTTPESLDIRVELNVGCTSNLEQTSQNFSSSGGEGEITLNTQSGCRLPATSSDSWIYAFSTNTGTVRYIVAANYDSQPRTGTFIIGGQSFTVQQSASVTACVQPPPNLVAWWRGEGNVLDQTGVNNGTLVGEMSFGGGKVGGGFKNDSNLRWYNTNNVRYASVPDSVSLTLTEAITFEGWIKINSYSANEGTIIQRRTTGFGSIGSYEVSVSYDGRLNFYIYYNGNAGFIVGSPPNTIPLGQFVHFAATRDGTSGQHKIYINGSLVRQATDSRRPNTLSGAEIKIGMIDGITDELSIYNRALSASEIQAIYNAGIASTGSAGKCLSTNSNINHSKFDFDGDRKSDISIFRPESGVWHLLQSQSDYAAVGFGLATDKLVPADFDGDGKTDVAVFRENPSDPGKAKFFILQSSNNQLREEQFGATGDIPIAGDWDGDGKSDVGVYRTGTAANPQGYFYYRPSSQPATNFIPIPFGAPGDKPVVADFDSDGKTDAAVFRPSNGVWYIQRSRDGFFAIQFGSAEDRPVVGDYDGDGRADQAVFRPSNGVWYIWGSRDGFSAAQFGASTDKPVPGDYDGDNKHDLAIYREGTWFILNSTNGLSVSGFGNASDKPVAYSFVP
jgi:hypothetical protein